jgi:carbamoyl-phosphate synthase large subunit
MDRQLTVAITGLNARPENPAPGVAVARCLAASPRQRIRLVGLGYESLDSGLYRRDLFDATYLLPFPTAGSDRFLERLLAIHAAEAIDVLIPCLDAELPLCISLAETLRSAGIRTFLPTADQFSVRSKERLMETAKEAGIPTPETRRIADPAFFHTCALQDWPYPLVVKGSMYEAVVAHTPVQAVAAFHQIVSRWGYPVLVQRFIGGDECNLCVIGDGEGGMIGPVMMKKRALTEKGKAWAGVCIQDDVVLEAASRVISVLRWRGPCEIEGIRSGGKYHLFEINPRFPSWVYFTHGVGRNLPAALVDLAMDRPAPEMPEVRVGSHFVRYAEEVVLSMHEFEAVVIGGSIPSQEKVPLWTP